MVMRNIFIHELVCMYLCIGNWNMKFSQMIFFTPRRNIFVSGHTGSKFNPIIILDFIYLRSLPIRDLILRKNLSSVFVTFPFLISPMSCSSTFLLPFLIKKCEFFPHFLIILCHRLMKITSSFKDIWNQALCA